MGDIVLRGFRGRPLNASAAFIRPCRPVVATQPPTGPGWAHELKHDGYRLQIHVRDGRVRLYTINGDNWTDRYPRIVEEAIRIKGSVILDAEVVCAGKDGVPDFEELHSRIFDHLAVACAFDLLMLNGEDFRRKRFVERKAALAKLLFRSRDGIQYVEHAEAHGDKMFEAVCTLGLEGIVSKKLDTPYRSGPSNTWIKIKNPKSPAAGRDQTKSGHLFVLVLFRRCPLWASALTLCQDSRAQPNGHPPAVADKLRASRPLG
jgi:bifunctional non-homologous end joining protein LigD